MITLTARQAQKLFGGKPIHWVKGASSVSLIAPTLVPEIHLTIPLIPPSVNHYKGQRVVNGKTIYFLTPEAKAFRNAVAFAARAQRVQAKQYEVFYAVFLGKGERQDVDNSSKCTLDSLQNAGVIHSDAAVTVEHIYKFRDADNPRTEIYVRPARKAKDEPGNFNWLPSLVCAA